MRACPPIPTRGREHAQPRRRLRWPCSGCLSLPEPPTAALCFNDVVAIGVIYALDGRGLAAGRDFAVVGFDDIADARLIHPPLTTLPSRAKGSASTPPPSFWSSWPAPPPAHSTSPAMPA